MVGVVLLTHVCYHTDVVGVVKVCNDLSTVIGKASQKEITKRDLQIVDQSGVAINITLWGNDVSSKPSMALSFPAFSFVLIA